MSAAAADPGDAGTSGRRALRLAGALPRRYPVTLVWGALMILMKSGLLEGAPAALAVVSAVAAPIMIPAYVVGMGWLGVGVTAGVSDALWFEIAGVLIVAGAYLLLDRALRAFRTLAAGKRVGPKLSR